MLYRATVWEYRNMTDLGTIEGNTKRELRSAFTRFKKEHGIRINDGNYGYEITGIMD